MDRLKTGLFRVCFQFFSVCINVVTHGINHDSDETHNKWILTYKCQAQRTTVVTKCMRSNLVPSTSFVNSSIIADYKVVPVIINCEFLK